MNEDGKPDMVASPFIVILCSAQSCSILLRTTVTVFIVRPPLPDQRKGFSLL